MATQTTVGKTSPGAKPTGLVRSGTRFDWLAMGSLLWIIFGVIVDGNAHFHKLVTNENPVFTPWHVIMYTGLLAAGYVHIGTTFRNWGLGYSWDEAIPCGYRYALLGVVLGIVGGIADLTYHSFFGVEASVEGLLSPTHMILLTAFLMVFSGPFLSLWLRSARGTRVGWKTGAPAVMSLMVSTIILTAFFDYLSPFSGMLASQTAHSFAYTTTIGAIENGPSVGEIMVGLWAASFLVSGAFIMGLVLGVGRKVQLPFGAWAVILTMSALVLSVFWNETHFVLVALVGGLLIDVATRRWLRPGQWGSVYYRLAFVLPVVMFSLYFTVLAASNALWWDAHVVFGCIAFSGVGGTLAAYWVRPSYGCFQAEPAK